MERKSKENTCKTCFKIICPGCEWEPDEKEVLLIQQGVLTVCPKCGWEPGKS